MTLPFLPDALTSLHQELDALSGLTGDNWPADIGCRANQAVQNSSQMKTNTPEREGRSARSRSRELSCRRFIDGDLHRPWIMPRIVSTSSATIPPQSRFAFILGLAFSTGLLAATVATSGLAAALPPYDGMWSVSIVTEQGFCNNGFKYSIHIKDSTLSNGGDAPGVISGTVTGRGSLSVAIVHGYSSATGSGQLSASNGQGKWKAASCSGYWTAAREP